MVVATTLDQIGAWNVGSILDATPVRMKMEITHPEIRFLGPVL